MAGDDHPPSGLASSSPSSPSLSASAPVPRVRIKLTKSTHPIIHNGNGSSPGEVQDVKPSSTPPPPPPGPPFPLPPRVQESSLLQEMQEDRSGAYFDRLSESLSPAPEGSLASASQSTDSPRRIGLLAENDEKLIRRDLLADSAFSNSTSPTKAVRRRRPEPTHICSRDYAPLPPEAQVDPQGEGWSKRSERKSKTDASNAMNGSASNAEMTSNGGDDGPPNPSMHPLRKVLASQGHESPLPPLPLNTSSTDDGQSPSIPTHHSTPRESPARQRPRLYELEEAPVFYPTREEFADPLRYIQHVGDPQGGNGKAYGIVKIVPPAGWNPEFVLNQDRFRFRTRMQRLNSLSADARASLNYQEQLQKFHAQQGQARVSIPVVDRRPVDLYNLKLIVGLMGGYEMTARGRKWAEVTRRLGYEEKDACHLAAQIKAAYTRIILPFEKFLVANREAVKRESQEGKQRTTSPEQQFPEASSASPSHAMTAPAHQTHFSSPAWEEMEADRSMDDLDGSKRRSSRKRIDSTRVASMRGKRNGISPNSDGNGGNGKGDVVIVPGAEEQMCEICLRGDNGTSMLLCDECNRGYHMYCLDPPLTSIPKSEWYCPPCLVGTGNDYGFDDGETHSLSSFWNRAESFRKAWWSKRENQIWKAPNGASNGLTRSVAGTGLRVSEDDVEREFWRLVHSPDETVEVEYGADVHSTTHGSALPTLETFPLSPYARDGWNLNNLPILPGSLLRYIKSDISGMTVPWIYIGMIFSTFCWHNEDHHTYSINYQHFGDTKTWYGVPGADAHLLEEALRAAAPDLFEQSPDLLFQLVTMMSPDKLKKHGVRVYACDQRANEFVITYPKAYHAGFNHGFNLNEAVNFALPDWIELGLESVRRYQTFSRFPVFSHDELIMTVYQHNQSVDTAMWLQAPMEEMVQREIEKRNELRRLIPNLQEDVDEVDKPEPEYQCAHCNVFCYLGQVISDKADGVACLDHANQVCGIDSPSKWTLRTRFSDEALMAVLAKTVERAAIPTTWKSRLQKLIVSSPRPNLRNLRGLLHEGEKIPFQMAEVDELKAFVDKANRWVDEATTFIARKHQKRSGTGKDSTTGSRRGKRGSKVDEEEGEQGEAGEQERVYTLLSEAELLPFDAPEIGALRGVVDAMEEFKSRTREIFNQVRHSRAPSIAECEEVLSLGNSLNVKFDELDELQRYVGMRKWVEEVEDIRDKFTDLAEVEGFLEEGRALNVDPSSDLWPLLMERREAGVRWKRRAEAVLGLDESRMDKYELNFQQDDVEELLQAPYKVAIVGDLHVKAAGLLKHVREWSRQCENLVNVETVDRMDELAPTKRFVEACRLLKHMEEVRVVMKHERELVQMKRAQEVWERQVSEQVFLNKTWEPAMALDLPKRITDDYLKPAAESCSEGDDQVGVSGLVCICRSRNEGRGTRATCMQCREEYHVKCLGAGKREAKEPDWTCMFCKPQGRLRELTAARQRTKMPFDRFDAVYTRRSLGLEEDKARPPMQPWGESASYQRMGETLKLVGRLRALAFSPTMPSRERMAATVHLLKRMLACPLQLEDEVVFGYVETIEAYAASQTASQTARQQPQTSTTADWRSLRVDPVPPFRLTGKGAEEAEGRVDKERLAEGQRTDGGRGPTETGGLDGQRDVSFNTTADYSEGEEGGGSRPESSGKVARSTLANDDRKRKRGKRAKFVFEEEVGIFVPVRGVRVYCLCHQAETGTMISCERCSLWFHNSCVHIGSEVDLGDERWICPMCCVKTERKYAYAEVKVKGMGVTEANMWLDVRATLRSTRGPVNKLQSWTSEPQKRIVLHLESFYPATLPTTSDPAKRARQTDGSPAPRHQRGESNSSGGEVNAHNSYALGSVLKNPTWNDVKARVTPAHRTPSAEEWVKEQDQKAQLKQQARHEAGMANLYERGVTDAMIQKWFVGWNGESLVYHHRDRFQVLHEILLGSRIQLAPDDQDGSRMITSLMRKRDDERRREAARSEAGPVAEKGASSTAAGPTPARSASSTPSALSRPLNTSNPAPSTLPRASGSGSTWNQPSPLPPLTHHHPPLHLPGPHHHATPLARSPGPTVLPALPIPPFRNVSGSQNQPLGPYANRSPATNEMRSGPNPPPRSPALPQRHVHPPALPPQANASTSSASAHIKHSPRSSPYLAAQPLARSREGTPRTPNLQQSRPLPTSSSSPTPAGLKSGSPSEKSLEEMRMLARKMKPGASDGEIEMMVRQAMS